MVENYKLIADEAALDRFIEWLPNTSEDEVYYVALFARKKYDDSLKSTKTDRAQLARFVCDKRSIKHRIKQLEAPLGSYTLGDREPTQESLAIYINPNPRSMKKALWEMLDKGLHMARTEAYGFRLDQVALSCIQKSKSRSFTYDFDIDTKDPEDTNFEWIKDMLRPTSYRILETRGGYHILVHPELANIDHKDPELPIVSHWKDSIEAQHMVDDATNTEMIPIPGCYQGGFVPKFIL